MAYVCIDYETKSACDLKKSGAYVYSEHPTTDLTFAGYSFNGGEPHLWSAGNWNAGIFPDDPPEDLFKFLRDEDPYVVAHNAAFEKAMWFNVATPRYLWPDLPVKWIDTMASCARKAIPLALERAALVLRLHMQKNMEGAKALKDIMKPHKISKKNPRGLVWLPGCPDGYGWDNDPKKYYIVGEYCKQDVRAEDNLLDDVGKLTVTEQAVWELDQVINQRGIKIDLDYVGACEEIIEQATVPLTREFRGITGGINPTQREAVRNWLRGRLPETYDLGMDLMSEEDQLPDMKKDTMKDFMAREDLPADVNRLLEIRGDLTSTSIAKIGAMRRSTCADGRARNLLQYHAASPGRWGGRLIQPQNFPRGTVKADPTVLVADIMQHDAGLLHEKYGSAIQAVSTSLRHGMMAEKDHALVVGDFASIEARVVLAIAGQWDKIELIKNGADIYNDMATTIFKKPIDRKAKDENGDLLFPVEGQVGKNTVLGCGFQMGARRFKEQVKEQTGLIISFEMAEKAVQTYRTEFAPCVKDLWYALDEAATRAVWEHTTEEAYGITYQMKGRWLTARLPSGRCLFYYNPIPKKRAMPWDDTDIRRGFIYHQMKSGSWKTIWAYGGLLTENVVQATARDIMVDRMFAVELELGYPILLTIHDELITEVLASIANADHLQQVLEDAPAWANAINIPVNAPDCWVGDRYKKG